MVVGRCSETILREYKCLVSIFVGGDISKKAERVMKYYNMTEKEAREFMKEKDKRENSTTTATVRSPGEIPGTMISPSIAADSASMARFRL